MLEVRDIHTYYGESHILQGLSLKVERGSIVGILGRNGVGKTTLIRSIIGFTPPREGQVIFEGMRLAVVGFAVGLAGAMAAGRVLASLLHEVKPGDPAIFAATAGFLVLVALLACYLPAHRAAKLDPMTALRYE